MDYYEEMAHWIGEYVDDPELFMAKRFYFCIMNKDNE